MTAEYVLDSFAILAMLNREPGHDRVSHLLDQAGRGEATCRASTINLGEVVYITERRWGESGVRLFLATMNRTELVLADATWERILVAAGLKAHFPVSYADAFAIALAQEFGATLLTGDPEFKAVSHLITIEWLADAPSYR